MLFNSSSSRSEQIATSQKSKYWKMCNHKTQSGIARSIAIVHTSALNSSQQLRASTPPFTIYGRPQIKLETQDPMKMIPCGKGLRNARNSLSLRTKPASELNDCSFRGLKCQPSILPFRKANFVVPGSKQFARLLWLIELLLRIHWKWFFEIEW